MKKKNVRILATSMAIAVLLIVILLSGCVIIDGGGGRPTNTPFPIHDHSGDLTATFGAFMLHAQLTEMAK